MTKEVTLYHNPRCSKSREALKLLQEKEVDIHQIRYLETPPDAAGFKKLVQQLGLEKAHDLLRTQEADYKASGLTGDSSDKDVIDALTRYPKMMKRPIAIVGDKAILGRPPEKVLELV